MKSRFFIAASFVGVQLLIGCAFLWFSTRSTQKAQQLRASVSDYEKVLRDAREAENRSKQLESEGAAKFSYQMFLAQRTNLRKKFNDAVTGAGLDPGDAKFDDKHVEMTMTGSHLKALKFLWAVEQEFPELRMRSISISAQKDGLISLNTSYDLWPIPAPKQGAQPNAVSRL